MAPTTRKSPTITISPSDYDTQPPSRSWWKRTMSRRSRNLLFLMTLISLGYFITGSRSRQDLQQHYLNQSPDYRPQTDSIPQPEAEDIPSTKLSPSSMPSSYLADAVAAVNPAPEFTEIHNNDEEIIANATIGMVTMLYGDPNPVYERALQSHVNHGKMHGYPVYVLRQKLLGRLWSKPAYILSIILNELQKPKESRLKWLFWFDADTVLINPKIPLEMFIPPAPEFEHIHFLCGDDHNGLNDGAFLLRINDYSMHLMAAALTVESFRPEVNLRFSEQSAIEHVVASEDIVRPWESFSYTDGYAKIPQRWMNAYMGPRSEEGVLKPKKHIKGNSVKEGDMLVHFAGSGETKRRRMSIFMDALERNGEQWEIEPESTGYMAEISAFWTEWKKVEEKRRKAIEEEVKRLEAEEAKLAAETSAAMMQATYREAVVETASAKPEKKKHHSESSNEQHKPKHQPEPKTPKTAQHAGISDTVSAIEEHNHDTVADHDVERHEHEHEHDHDVVSDDSESFDDVSSQSDGTATSTVVAVSSSTVLAASTSASLSLPETPSNKHTRREMRAGKIRREEARMKRRNEAALLSIPPPSMDTDYNLVRRDVNLGAKLDKSKMMKRRIKRIL